MGSGAKGAQRPPQACVRARPCLTDLLVTWFFTERGPILAKLAYFMRKMGIYQAFWLGALRTGLVKLMWEWPNWLDWTYFLLSSVQ